MFERILVPLDGSEVAAGVLPLVEELAPKVGADVILLRAVPTLTQLLALGVTSGIEATSAGVAVDAQLANDAYEAERGAAHAYLDEVRARLEQARIHADTEVVEGDAARCILDHADRVSLIAMSTHGRGGLGRLLMGSVAEEVLRSAPVPMLLVRYSEEEEAEAAA